jgi:hypothetical protein
MAKHYAVYAGLSFTVIVANSIDDARWHALINYGLERKPWLAKDWKIHRATPDERRRALTMMDNDGSALVPQRRSGRPMEGEQTLFE